MRMLVSCCKDQMHAMVGLARTTALGRCRVKADLAPEGLVHLSNANYWASWSWLVNVGG